MKLDRLRKLSTASVRPSAVILTMVVTAVTACSSSKTTAQPAPRPATITSTSSVASVPTAATTDPPAPAAAKGIATDPQGDAVEVSLTIGDPTPASYLHGDAVTACASDLEAAGSSLDRSLAVPITATAKLTTPSPVRFELELNYVASVQHGVANLDPNTYASTTTAPYWAMSFENGPICSSESPTGGEVSWKQLSPSAPSTWHAWIILADQNTPASPSLDDPDSFANTLLLSPRFYLATGDIQELPIVGPSIVDCAHNDYVAINPLGAKAQGCT